LKTGRFLTDDVPGMRTFAEICNYLKLKLHLETKEKIMRVLGYKSITEITSREQDNRVPVLRLLALCSERNISADELFFGKEPKDFMSRQFEREDIARRIIGGLARIEKENPDYYRRLYRDVIGEVDWINTGKKTEMAKRLVSDRSVLLRHNRKKMIELMLFFVANTENCEMFKLFKLMYFLDFLHFRHTGRSVTGLVYFAWKQGPVPADLYVEITERPKPDFMEAMEVKKAGNVTTFISYRPWDLSIFSRRETRMMNELAEHFKETESKSITEKYYLPKEPWFKTFTTEGEGKLIRYMMAIDGRHGLTRREIIERQEEMRDMYRSFGISWETVPAESGDLYNPSED